MRSTAFVSAKFLNCFPISPSLPSAALASSLITAQPVIVQARAQATAQAASQAFGGGSASATSSASAQAGAQVCFLGARCMLPVKCVRCWAPAGEVGWELHKQSKVRVELPLY
jgi:hypothetical protein